MTLAINKGAAHAVNFSHPRRLADLVLARPEHQRSTLDETEATQGLIVQGMAPAEGER